MLDKLNSNQFLGLELFLSINMGFINLKMFNYCFILIKGLSLIFDFVNILFVK